MIDQILRCLMKASIIIAWAWGSVSLWILIAKTHADIRYRANVEQQLKDAAAGVNRAWPKLEFVIYVIVCVAWIIATW